MKRSLGTRLKRGGILSLPVAVVLIIIQKIFFLIADFGLVKMIPGPRFIDGIFGILLIILVVLMVDKLVDLVPLDRPMLKLLENKIPFFLIYRKIMKDKEGKTFREVAYYDGGVLRTGILMSEGYKINVFGKELVVYNVLEPRPASGGGRIAKLQEHEFCPTGRSGFETLKENTIGYGIR